MIDGLDTSRANTQTLVPIACFSWCKAKNGENVYVKTVKGVKTVRTPHNARRSAKNEPKTVLTPAKTVLTHLSRPYVRSHSSAAPPNQRRHAAAPPSRPHLPASPTNHHNPPLEVPRPASHDSAGDVPVSTALGNSTAVNPPERTAT